LEFVFIEFRMYVSCNADIPRRYYFSDATTTGTVCVDRLNHFVFPWLEEEEEAEVIQQDGERALSVTSQLRGCWMQRASPVS
jgi:hypothetical protein